MIFPTVAFAVFFVIAFLVNWLLRPTYRAWLVAMAALSFFFYGYSHSQRPYVLLLLASAAVNWALGQAVAAARAPDRSKTERSIFLVRLAVAANLAVLGYFKYFLFVSRGVGYHPTWNIVLPVAISFFTFHAISYVVDIGRGDTDPLALGEFVVYLSFFPHLVAGPIVRASEFGPQLRQRPDPRSLPFAEATRLIAAGLFKKVVVSSFVASQIADPVFSSPNAHSALEILVAVYAYAVQIYADFSGYTDIAIGCALLLGIRFPQNFDAPYRALSLQDFWRRWHMTLSRWLRDYLYIPLGGNRRSAFVADPKVATYLNLFLTMFIGGIWHGAAGTFIVWGAIHGAYLGIERFVRERWAATHTEPVLPAAVSGALRWFATFHVVCFAWIFFRAQSLGLAWQMITGLFGRAGPGPTLVSVLLLVTIALMLLSQWVPPDLTARLQRGFTMWRPAAQVAALAGALTVIDVLGPDGVPTFIYFQF